MTLFCILWKQVYIEGRIQYRTYDDRDGNKSFITEVVATHMQMLGSRGGVEESGGYNRGDQSGGSCQGKQNQNQGQSQNQGQQSQVEEPPFNSDDDIPF